VPRARRARIRFATPLVLAALLLVPTAGNATAADGAGRPTEGGHAWSKRTATDDARLIVTYVSGTSRQHARDAEHEGLELVNFKPAKRRAVFQTTGESLRSEQRRLERDPAVRSVQISHRLYRDLDPENEQFWQFLWGLHNTGQEIQGFTGVADVDVDGREALGVANGGGVVVAVIDDGVDFSRPDLAGQAWVNPGESGGGKENNNVDDDGNGYIDDVNGWDFCHDDKTLHDVNDDFHGTHVSGTIAAKLDGAGIVGVSPGVKIMALKFLGDDAACGWDDQAIAAIEYAKSFGVRISNNSWGRTAGAPGEDTALRDAIADSGMLFVVSAGNSGVNNDTSLLRAVPASFDLPNILSVAAIDNQGLLADFSNYGPTSVDVAAPGVDIASNIPAYDGTPAGYYYLSGTSMASPHVTGIAALIGSQSPALLDSPTDLKKRILDTAKDIGETLGDTVTGRVADAASALDTTDPTAFAPNSYAFVTGIAMGSSITTRVRWPAATDDLSGVASYALRQSVNGAAWTTVTASTTALSSDRSLGFSKGYRYRVRAQDKAGNTGDYVDGPLVTPKLTQQTGSGATYGGTWTTSSSSSASGGSTRYATKAGAWVQFSFTGRAVGLITPKGTSRGSAKVYVDGTYVGTTSEYRSSSQSRIVLFARNWGSSGSHTVKFVLTGTSGHSRFDIDAWAHAQ
jgi:subtilisin family serine protease